MQTRREFLKKTAGTAAGATMLVAGTASFRGGPDAYASNIAGLKQG